MARPASPLAAQSRSALGLTLVALLALLAQQCSAEYYGKLIGRLSELHHGVSGEVYAVDARTLFIKDFTYDGEAPAAYFYAGSSKTIGPGGFKVRDERGTTNALRKYRKEGISVTLPEGKTLNNIKWLSVYCDEYDVNFGDVKIPSNFDTPRPQKLASLSGIHGVSSEPVVVVDAQTLLIPSFSYDGEAPDAKFWAGPGASPSAQGIRIADENGREVPLRRYDHKTIVLTLPGDLTIHELGHFGVWCEAFTVDFGHVKIPQALNVPPSLKMLGVSPQNVQDIGDVLARAGLARPPAPAQPHQQRRHQQAQRPYQRATTYRPQIRRREDAPGAAVQIVPALDYQLDDLVANGRAAAEESARRRSDDRRQELVRAQPAQTRTRFQQYQPGRQRLESYRVQY